MTAGGRSRIARVARTLTPRAARRRLRLDVPPGRPARPTIAAAAAFALAACAPGREPPADVDPAEVHAAVDSLLAASARAWNGGDLDGFVSWYQRGPETTFIGATGLLHGWDAVRERYSPLFQPGASRDSLRFEGLETRPLAPGLGLATARYVLVRDDSVTDRGVFTLILRRTPAGWRIVHDHSASTTD